MDYCLRLLCLKQLFSQTTEEPQLINDNQVSIFVLINLSVIEFDAFTDIRHVEVSMNTLKYGDDICVWGGGGGGGGGLELGYNRYRYGDEE